MEQDPGPLHPFPFRCNLAAGSRVLLGKHLHTPRSRTRTMRHNRSVVAIFCFALVSCWLLPTNSVAQPPTPQPTPVEIRIEPAGFDPFVGQYEDAENLGGTIFSFFREGDKYYLQVINQDRLELAPSAAGTFFVTENPRLTAEFVRDAAGRVTGMTWRQGAQEFRTRKLADKPLPDARVTYKRTEAMIPMRDGVKLFTVILTPEVQAEPLPILLNRTPYGVEGWNSARLNG